MSVRGDNVADFLQRTSSLPVTTAFTICGWAKRKVNTANWTYFAGMENSGSTDWLLIGLGNGTDVVEIAAGVGGPATMLTIANDEWFFFAITCQGTGAADFKGYMKKNLADAFTKATATGRSFTPVALTIFNDLSTEFFNGEMYAVKIWSRVLSEADLTEEAKYTNPIKPDVYNWSPLEVASGADQDFGPLNNDWTVGGTLTNGSNNPPISYAGGGAADDRYRFSRPSQMAGV